MPVDDSGRFVASKAKAKQTRATRSRKTKAKRKEGEPHKYRDYFQGVPMGEQMPPSSFPPEMADWLAEHIEKLGLMHVDEIKALAVDGKVDVRKLASQTIKHRYRAGEPPFFISPGEWVDINEPDPVADQAPDVPDLSGVDTSVLDAMERAIVEARIAKAKIAQADPAARAAIEEGKA